MQALLNHSAKVYVTSRSRAKADAATQGLKEFAGKEQVLHPFVGAGIMDLNVGIRQQPHSEEKELHIFIQSCVRHLYVTRLTDFVAGMQWDARSNKALRIDR